MVFWFSAASRQLASCQLSVGPGKQQIPCGDDNKKGKSNGKSALAGDEEGCGGYEVVG